MQHLSLMMSNVPIWMQVSHDCIDQLVILLPILLVHLAKPLHVPLACIVIMSSFLVPAQAVELWVQVFSEAFSVSCVFQHESNNYLTNMTA